MKLSRRAMIAGLAAVPAAASASEFTWRHGHGTVLLFDADLPQGRAFAEAGRAWNRSVMPLSGDRIRFAREVFARRPAIVRGVSRQADAVLLAEVAGEAGYEQVSLKLDGAALEWTFAPKIRR
jgi:hypothetical protein